MSQKQVRFKTLPEWLKWQEGLHFTSIELGLDRCKAVADNLGLLSPEYAVISVAGTNGKGSSVTMLNNILTEAGYKTGSYMSPHLIRYNERICVGGVEVDDKTICKSFARIDEARGKISLTYFEFGTLAAMDIFRNEKVDIAILEVGLGGRLDAINILDADVALVSSIALDHEFWLGKDRETIAFEKAGIFRGDKPAVCSDPNPPETLVAHAEDLGTRLSILDRDYHYEFNGENWDWLSEGVQYRALPKPCEYNYYQIQNASGVLMALTELPDRFPVSETAIRDGLKNFQLEGRFQVIQGDVTIIMDVAHNAEAASILVDNLERMPTEGKTHIVIGMLNDKDHRAVFGELRKVADNWRIVELNSLRATESQVLLNDLEKSGNQKKVKTFNDMHDALVDVHKEAEKGDRIIITGSFITVGAAISQLQNLN